MSHIEVIRGDITRVRVDAIVNAANARLLPGGGVCGAIHSAGGPSIAEECREVIAERGPLSPGEAAPTGAGRIPARYVIHAVGPVWNGGRSGEPETLASAYRSSMEIADELGLGSIAFPSISTGIFGYPVELAVPVALAAVKECLDRGGSAEQVTFVLFDENTFRTYEEALRELS